MDNTLRGSTVLVTGATGFLGSRLVEHLVTVDGAQVRATTLHYGRAARIARLPIELINLDILDVDGVIRATEGCDYVFHCAYGTSGTAAMRHEVTVQGTHNILKAASLAQVKRVVHISSVAVHGRRLGDVCLDENSPLTTDRADDYAWSKAEAERVITAWAQEHDTPVAIVRPSNIYGPFSTHWTLSPAQRMQEGKFGWIDEGQGICNPIYIDDVVRALLIVATHPVSVGEVFIVSDAAVTWRTFFGYYLRMLGLTEVPSWDAAKIARVRRRQEWVQSGVGRVLSYLGSPRAREMVSLVPGIGSGLRFTWRALPKRLRKSLDSRTQEWYASMRWPIEVPSIFESEIYRSRVTLNTAKAEKLLGFRPQVSLARGMELCEAWLRNYGYIV